MRLTLMVLLAVMTMGVAVPAFAELQNVTVGGSIRIRGNYLSDPALSFDNDSPDDMYVEQRTKLNVTADFTDDVTAFIELDHYGKFGEPGTFRSDVVKGDDGFTSASDVQLYQAYIEMREAGGYPLTVRIGRQEILFGSEWLIGNNDTASSFQGLSFDGVVVTYAADEFSITAFWLRLLELGMVPPLEAEEDTDVWGIYGSYNGIEDMVIEAYWIWVDSARTRGVADLNSGSLHTIGARVAGTYSQLDYEVEGAYQFGDAIPGTAMMVGAVGSGGAGDVEISSFAVHGEAGWTFDSEYQPRVFVAGAYYGGGDDLSTLSSGGGDVSFNRLFSDHEYSEFLGNTDLSNFWVITAGASAQVREDLELSALFSYFSVVEDMGTNDDSVGFEIGVYATYAYSEDLIFESGYAAFFPGDGIEDGAPISGNGLRVIGGTMMDDVVHYFYIESRIRFN